MELELKDKVCVVTGATEGIGLAATRQLQAEGAKVVTSSRRAEGPGDLHIAADLATPGEPQRVIDTTLEAFGRVDCLVNNLGWAEIHRFDELTEEIWERSWQINLMSAVRATQAVLPGMKERGEGAIVNVSSTAAKRPSAGMPEYSVMKAAMLSFSRLVADLHARTGSAATRSRPAPPPRPRGWPTAASPTSRANATRSSPRSAPDGRSDAWRRPTRSRGDRLPLLRPRELRHRRRVERRRRHRPDHHLEDAPSDRREPDEQDRAQALRDRLREPARGARRAPQALQPTHPRSRAVSAPTTSQPARSRP